MTPHNFSRLMLLGCCIYILSGCAHVISSELRQQANAGLTFSAVHQNAEAYKGSIVIWGGEIIETLNHEQGTDIIVLQTPLTSDERPEAPSNSLGRFIARSSKFIDPAIYRRGRRVTVAGEIVGAEAKPLGKIEYNYPVLSIKEIHLWRRVLVRYPPDDYGGWWGWGWGPRMGWGPGWGWARPYYGPYDYDYDYEWQWE